MGQISGRADAPKFFGGDLQAGLSINASVERLNYADDAKTDYVKKNFDDNTIVDRSFALDTDWIVSKRTELAIGGSAAGDGVTTVQTGRASLGQWFFGDQLRIGANISSSLTKRPPNEILDYDAKTIVLKPRVVSTAAGLSVKGILNPTTVVSGDYVQVKSTERPRLQAGSVGLRQFMPSCNCAFHGDVSRIINLGALDTNMSSGELTASQWSLAYLQTLDSRTHARLAYRYAREDEFTRAYSDHLLFGSDSYTAAFSHEFQQVRMNGSDRPLLIDLAATRYIDNQGASATTFEAGAGVKF